MGHMVEGVKVLVVGKDVDDVGLGRLGPNRGDRLRQSREEENDEKDETAGDFAHHVVPSAATGSEDLCVVGAVRGGEQLYAEPGGHKAPGWRVVSLAARTVPGQCRLLVPCAAPAHRARPIARHLPIRCDLSYHRSRKPRSMLGMRALGS